MKNYSTEEKICQLLLPEPHTTNNDFEKVPVYILGDDGVLHKEKIVKQRFGPGLKKAQELSGVQNPIFKVIGQIGQFDSEAVAETKKEALAQLVKGIERKGKMAGPGGMGSNALMKNEVVYMAEHIIDEWRNWSLCGARFDGDEKIANMISRTGLLMPYTTEMVDYKLSPRTEQLFKSYTHEVNGNYIDFKPDGKCVKVLKALLNEFDGQCVFHMTEKAQKKMKLSKRDLVFLLNKIEKFNGGTMRAPLQKGAVIVGFDIHQRLHDLGVHRIGGRDIDEICIFGDETVFKAAIGDKGNFKDWNEYCYNFTEMKHRFGLLLENHGPKLGNLPAQQLHSVINGNMEALLDGAEAEVNYLNESADPEIAAKRYIKGGMGEISGIANFWWAEEMINTARTKELMQALSGTTHNNTYTCIICTDLLAMCDWIAILEGVLDGEPRPYLDEYTVYIPGLPEEVYGEMIGSRNPNPARYGLIPVNVIGDMGECEKYFSEKFRFAMVPMGKFKIRTRADNDGDKCKFTFAKWFVRLIKDAEARGVDLIALWEDGFGSAVKAPFTDENIRKFFSTAYVQSTLGMNFDFITKLYDNGLIPDEKWQLIGDYATNKGTDTKHGEDSTKFYGDSGRVWNQMVEMAKAVKITKSHAYAKILKNKEPKKDKVHDEWTNCSTDIIGKSVKERAIRKVHFNGKSPDKLLLKGGKWIHINGLTEFGTAEMNYEDGGIFKKFALLHCAEQKELVDNDEVKNTKAFNAMYRERVIEEIAKWAFMNGYSMDDVIDSITTDICKNFKKYFYGENTTDKKRNLLMIMARFWRILFEKDVVANYNANAGTNIEAVEVSFDDDESDDDGIDF